MSQPRQLPPPPPPPSPPPAPPSATTRRLHSPTDTATPTTCTQPARPHGGRRHVQPASAANQLAAARPTATRHVRPSCAAASPAGTTSAVPVEKSWATERAALSPSCLPSPSPPPLPHPTRLPSSSPQPKTPPHRRTPLLSDIHRLPQPHGQPQPHQHPQHPQAPPTPEVAWTPGRQPAGTATPTGRRSRRRRRRQRHPWGLPPQRSACPTAQRPPPTPGAPCSPSRLEDPCHGGDGVGSFQTREGGGWGGLARRRR